MPFCKELALSGLRHIYGSRFRMVSRSKGSDHAEPIEIGVLVSLKRASLIMGLAGIPRIEAQSEAPREGPPVAIAGAPLQAAAV
jgi:hypothetical protein